MGIVRFLVAMFWGAVALIVALVIARFVIILVKGLPVVGPVGQAAEHYSGIAA